MNTSKHTPGPWHRNIKPASKYTTVWAGRNTHVAYVHTGTLPEEQIEANAHLIAAAPAMYEAIKALIVEWNRHGCCDSRDVVYRAEQALAQAEGK